MVNDEINALENESKEYMNKWSILDKAEKLCKEYGIEDTDCIYQTKSYWASKFVNKRKEIEKIKKSC